MKKVKSCGGIPKGFIDEENWDGESDSTVRTKWHNIPKRTHEKRENAANERISDSTGASP